MTKKTIIQEGESLGCWKFLSRAEDTEDSAGTILTQWNVLCTCGHIFKAKTKNIRRLWNLPSFCEKCKPAGNGVTYGAKKTGSSRNKIGPKVHLKGGTCPSKPSYVRHETDDIKKVTCKGCAQSYWREHE